MGVHFLYPQAPGNASRAFLITHPPTKAMNRAIRMALTVAIDVLNHTPVQKRLIAYLRLLRIKTH